MINKILILLTALASLTIANAFAGTPYLDWVIKKAHQYGYTDRQIQTCAAMHMVWDSSDNSFVDGSLNAQQRAAFADITSGKTTPNEWIYLHPDFNAFGYRDRSGVLHAWQADAARYNQRTRLYQVQINGRWLTVGVDVFQLTDVN
jgi:hypothetical protein